MIQVFPAHTRNTTDLGWLKSHKNFSFGDYFDEDNVGFGVMRVCNDDDIAAGRGFGPHPHSDMEIVSIVLSGAIKHEDSLGHVAVTGVNGVQRMSAGSGVIHAEYNASDTEPMSLFQLWFMPSKRGLEPSFENVTYEPKALVNALLPVVTPEGGEHAARIHQDMSIYLSKLEAGKELVFRQAENRRIFLMLISGKLSANDAVLETKDSARMEAEQTVAIRAIEDTHFMLIDLP
ncbi:pirin family protein [Paenibacillus alginolyticus]|uniref:Pirin family protein n=1 Tax=Paenibacillus alginolyticus TaxID=59839 RepID=A0ABT4GG69_9BACL|nr:pirin family protein [Paenibacillus alginolyticus]MCY9695187.1 pirin family protein [Paenibacillus alginolyticus]MEC0143122.1 pirin family protein [Paenibacillus alginolyticus]